jgi:hypothetical protein
MELFSQQVVFIVAKWLSVYLVRWLFFSFGGLIWMGRVEFEELLGGLVRARTEKIGNLPS